MELRKINLSVARGRLRLTPLDPTNPEECRLWQSCQLSIYANNRLHRPVNGLNFDAEERDRILAQTLGEKESLVDPGQVDWVDCYWVYRDLERAGIVSVERPLPGIKPFLKVYDLYVAPPLRGDGLGLSVLKALRTAAEQHEFAGIILHTEWCWPEPLRYFLNRGFWVSGWKRDLSLVWVSELPEYEIAEEGDELAFRLRGAGAPPVELYRASRREGWLVWQETEEALERVADPARFYEWHYGRCTFALELALRGWPLVRDANTWNERLRWTDSGMPEGLADKISIFERLEREKGFSCGRSIQLPEDLPASPESFHEDTNRWPG